MAGGVGAGVAFVGGAPSFRLSDVCLAGESDHGGRLEGKLFVESARKGATEYIICRLPGKQWVVEWSVAVKVTSNIGGSNMVLQV